MNATVEPAESTEGFRLDWMRKLYNNSFDGISAIDLGCGSGLVCNELVKGGVKRAYGCDIVPTTPPDNTWDFFESDLQSDKWSQSILDSLSKDSSSKPSFNLLTAFDIIEHLPNPVSFLNQCRQLMDADSTLLLTTPNTGSWERLLKPNTWSGATDPQHMVLFSQYSLKFLMERTGFEVISIEAPIRKLGSLNNWLPSLGGQLTVVAKRKDDGL